MGLRTAGLLDELLARRDGFFFFQVDDREVGAPARDERAAELGAQPTRAARDEADLE